MDLTQLSGHNQVRARYSCVKTVLSTLPLIPCLQTYLLLLNRPIGMPLITIIEAPRATILGLNSLPMTFPVFLYYS